MENEDKEIKKVKKVKNQVVSYDIKKGVSKHD